MMAVEIADWSDFFVAMAGSAAALAGLLFVAISINIKEILSDDSLPRRAGQTVALLVSSLLVSGAALIPDLSESALGIVLLVVTGATWAFIALMVAREARPGQPGGEPREGGSWKWRVALTQMATLPAVIGSVVLIAGSANGLYFVAAGILISLAVAVINAWVLMVEILR
ncbi:MAG TPA: hypothetical protein VIY72_10935 [Acidimicrobiales bacterium]